jgi:predicted nuclease with RNAse H fold
MHFIGIDVAAARPSDIVVLDADLRETELLTSTDPPTSAPELAARYPEAVVAVDASRCLSRGLMAHTDFRASLEPPPADGKYLNCRSAEYELMRRNVSVYQTPEEMPDWLRAWLTEGFAWYEALIAADYADHSHDPTAGPPCVIESYPYANYVALLGGLPPSKSTRAGRVARVTALRDAGVDADFALMDVDQLDATVCAVAAARFAAGKAVDYGDPREGVLTVAAKLPDSAARIDAG